jgi:cellulose synthase/poly-beta-1,6-N-acetylglucosamine synthase-like glycosyltransferase
MSLSVGVITHNDSTLIRLLEGIFKQASDNFVVKEVFVISSGILPENEADLKILCGKHSNLKVVREPERAGKARSVNHFLKEATGDVCMLISGDILIGPNSIGKLVKPLRDDKVGMVGARIMPLNDESTFTGFVVHLVWKIHHNLSLIKPKVGEFVAFRNIVGEISPKTAVDEAWIESEVSEAGYRIAYAPDAMAHNMGPKNLREYMNQRRRIHIGHVNLKRERHYAVSSIMYTNVFRALLKSLTFKPKELLWTLLAILLEVYIRVSADMDVILFKRNPYCWDILDSAKIS